MSGGGGGQRLKWGIVGLHLSGAVWSSLGEV